MATFDQQIRQLRRDRLALMAEARTIQSRITPEASAAELRDAEREFEATMAKIDEVEQQIIDIEDKRDESTAVDESRRPGAGGTLRAGVDDADLAGLAGTRSAPQTARWHDTATGRDVRVVPRGQPFATATDTELPSFGGVVRAMVLGPRNDLERRALSEGTDSAGGFTVPEPLSRDFIDRLRARSVVFAAGAQTVEMTSETLRIAKWLTDPTVAWRAENASITESDPTIGQLVFTARSVAALFRASRELLEDSANITQMIENGIAQALAVELDRVALLGSGTAPEPTGIANTSGVGSVSMGTNGAALASYDQIVDLLQTLADADAADPTALVMAPRTRYALAKLKDGNSQPLQAPEVVRAVPIRATTSMPVDETQGTASDASRIIAGDFADLLIGVRSSLRIEVLRERYADTLQFGFLAHMRADVQVARPASFAQLVGITP